MISSGCFQKLFLVYTPGLDFKFTKSVFLSYVYLYTKKKLYNSKSVHFSL